MLDRLFQWIVDHPWRVLSAVAAVTVLAGVGGAALPFYTARGAMMPKDLPANQRFDAFLRDFGAAQDLILVLEGGDQPALDAYAERLVQALAAQPAIAGVTRGVPPAFLVRSLWLTMPPEALAGAAAALSERGEAGATAREVLQAVWPPAGGAADPPDADGLGEAAEALAELAPPAKVDLAEAARALAATEALLAEWHRWLTAPTAPAALDLAGLAAPFDAGPLVDGAFRSHDGRLAFVFVSPADPSEEFAVLDRLIGAVHAAQAQAPPPGGVTVGLTGVPALAHEEFVTVRGDVALIVASAAGLILLLIGFGLRSVRRAVAIFVPMGVGVVWNMGLTWLWVGHLSILTSSFTAILFGLGVDYGIFLSARVLAERAAGAEPRAAALAGVRHALPPLATAAGATALIFGALIPSGFPGFSELGLMAAGGVALILLSTLIVQPVLLVRWPVAPRRGDAAESAPTVTARRRPWLASAVAAVAVAATVGGVLGARALPFDYDVLALLPADSEAAGLQRRMVAESDFQGELLILTAPDVATLRAQADQVAALPDVAKVHRIDALFPPDAEARAAAARRVGAAWRASPWRDLLRGHQAAPWDAAALGGLDAVLEALDEQLADAQDQAFSAGHTALVAGLERVVGRLAAVRAAARGPEAGARMQRWFAAWGALASAGGAVLDAWATARPLTAADLPPGLRGRFFGRDGQVAAYVYPRHSVYDRDRLDALLSGVYAIAPEATGFPATHQVNSAVVVRAFREGTALAGVLALLWIALTLRRPRSVLLAAVPLVVGGAAMMAALWLGGFAFNFANIVALPLVMGLAVDYGVWFAHQEHRNPDRSGWQVAAVARRPILLAAETTLAGLGAITLASYRGVATMGLSLTVGLVACVLSALVVAPALTELFFRRRR